MPLYALTIFLSAFLLFQVQPLLAKLILPWFGGSAAVWTVTLMFFQTLLLFGYGYAHATIRWLGPRRQAEAVHARAERAFYEKGLHRTREETGILIFISTLERKVWILGDRGINERIPPGAWKALAAELAAGLSSGRATEALCRVIGGCGSELARHFPRRDDDRNELPDEILTS